MKKLRYWLISIILLAALLFAVGGTSSAGFAELGANTLARPAALTGPSALTYAGFAVLAGSTATNTGNTTVHGSVGVSPGSAITGFPPGVVTGGTIHSADAEAANAQVQATNEYNNLTNQACTSDLTGQDLGERTLTPGVYCFDTSAQLTGALILDALGDSNGVFVFKMVSTLTTASSSSVTLINGGNQCRVFWQVGSSATLGTGTRFAGNILAIASITLNTGASLVGRALARDGAVTMDTNDITNVCWSAQIPTPTAGVSATATSVEIPTPTTAVSATATSVVIPTPTTAVSATATSVVIPTPTTAVSATATTAVTATATDVVIPTPTSAPTATPTTVPTIAPTVTPTTVPTIAPTVAPTSVPTAVPTTAPTPAPTAVPPVVGLPATGGAAVLGGKSARRAGSLVATSAQRWISTPLAALGLDLRAPPVDVPLELQIPSLQIRARILAVGITSKNVMDAPMGPTGDPVWQKAFWYRGSAIPGNPGTATIAGHVTVRGQPALFAHLKDLIPGNLIVVYDTRSGLVSRFAVTEMQTYSVAKAIDPVVLARIFGSGLVADDLSHLTLVTCSGDLVRGSYDRRLVVYAQRVQVQTSMAGTRTLSR